MIPKVLTIIQVLLGLILIVAILLQQKGAGLGLAFGDSSNVYSTKRGIDKVIYFVTIIVAVLFFGLGLLNVFLG